ncbi:MAG: TraR/DksA C4-type zinc finger protein [Thermoleophilia bacterium]|nr:TraR/DksA C4-type zinc finger protein [Thermoleophilia bacterium]
MSYSDKELANLRNQLNTERKRVILNIDSLSSDLRSSITDSSDENGLETHIGDVGTLTFLRERDLSVELSEEHLLNEIGEALARIKLGLYGTCSECGMEIPRDRLEALPWAVRCVEDQARVGV